MNPNASSKHVDADTSSLLKKVESLRKWQEEEQQKLLRAHEQQLQQFKLEQERIARLVFQNQVASGMPNMSLPKQPLTFTMHNQASNDEDDDNDDYEEQMIDENDEEYDHVDEDFMSAKNMNDFELAQENPDHRLSTILEASCEEATPLKGHQSRTPKKLQNRRQLQWSTNPATTNGHSDEIEEPEEVAEGDEDNEDDDDEPQETTLRNHFDEIPVSGKGKSFNDLLKEKLKEEPVPVKSRSAPKVEVDNGDSEKENQGKNAPRKFLKRGEGLRRYQPRTKSSDERARSSEKQASASMSPKRNRSLSSNEKRLSVNNKKEAEAKPKPQSSAKPAASQKGANSSAPAAKKVQNSAQKPLTNSQKTIAATKPAAKTLVTNKPAEMPKSADEEHQNRFKANVNVPQGPALSNLNAKAVVECVNDDDDDEELKEFEALEQYAEDHASFRSSTSYVETLLMKHHQNGFKQVNYNAHLSDLAEETNDYESATSAMISKMSSMGVDRQLYRDSDDEEVDDDVEIYMKKSGDGYLDSTLTGQMNSSPIVLSKFSSSEITKKESGIGNGSSNANKVMQRKVTKINYEYVMSSENSDNDDFELKRNFNMNNIRKRLGSDDFMQSSTESLKEKIQASVGNASKPVYNCDSYKSESQCEVESSSKKQENEFEDDNTWLDESVVKMKRTVAGPVAKENEVEQMKVPAGDAAPISQLMTKLFPNLKPKQTSEVVEKAAARPESVGNVSSNENPALSSLLKEKLAQLESEIEKFRVKNLELTKMKEKHEQDLTNLESSMLLFEKQKQAEMAKFNEYKEEEIRKLKHERKLFDMYQKTHKDAPDRREREEIDKLKKQVSDLQEELKTKEVRWTANNTRMKDRIESLEKERDDLKKELLLIEKQRLEMMVTVQSKDETKCANQKLTASKSQSSLLMAANQQAKELTKPASAINRTPYGNQPLAENVLLGNEITENVHSKLKSSISPNNPNELAMHGATNANGLTRSISDRTLTNRVANQAPKMVSQLSEPVRYNNYLNENTSVTEPPELQAPPIMSMYTNALSSMSQNKSQNDSYDTISNKSASHLTANSSKSVKFKLDQKDSVPNAVDTKLAQQQMTQPQISPQQLVTSLINGRQIKIREMQRFEDGRCEKILEDGSVITEFINGTFKEVSADKRHVLVKFFNGDRKEMNQDAGTETYFYAQTNVTQVTYSDGLQVLKFPNGQVEKHYPNDTKEIIFPDKIVKLIYTDGSEESRLTNGTVIKVDVNGDKLIEYTNGQREIHTKDFKRREYPDGSVKTVYANGISETRYANGRIRVKDEFGNILTDKKE